MDIINGWPQRPWYLKAFNRSNSFCSILLIWVFIPSALTHPKVHLRILKCIWALQRNNASFSKKIDNIFVLAMIIKKNKLKNSLHQWSGISLLSSTFRVENYCKRDASRISTNKLLYLLDHVKKVLWLLETLCGSRYSRMDQVNFVEDSL